MSRQVEVGPNAEKTRKTRVSFDVPAAVHNRFKASCGLHGKNMSDRLAEIMDADAEATGIPTARVNVAS